MPEDNNLIRTPGFIFVSRENTNNKEKGNKFPNYTRVNVTSHVLIYNGNLLI
jgi:hypothetical protein